MSTQTGRLTMSEYDFDVIVVGGGYAGLTAARNLTREGHRVALLEGRDRLGGKVFTDTFGDTGVTVDLGGAWSPPGCPFMEREMSDYGLEWGLSRDAQSNGYLIGGQRIEHPVPLLPEEILGTERTAFELLEMVHRIDPTVPIEAQHLDDLDVSWRELLDRLAPPPGFRDLLESWPTTEGGRPSDEFSALMFLWWTANRGNSLANWFMLEMRRPLRTMDLVEAMVAESTAEVHYGAAVTKVDQDADGVVVTVADGTALRARGAVIAVPVSCWDSIEFSPGLSESKTKGAELRPVGTGLKGWALVKDAPPAFSGLASVESGCGVTTVISEYDHGDAQLMSYFTPLGYRAGAPRETEFDIHDLTQVQKAFDQFMPGCTVLEVGGHDWARDEFANGGWAAYPVGLLPHLSGMRAPEGRLSFASADIAERLIGWIDGAIESGYLAATQQARNLER
ncbi:flavin monoamine oxidase family protein [Rhodococcus sp. NPDC057014]|uniref:flavin monoamine oxidase family protein n=1 Tax=Rhodococcus sp. NPDC057014 TaxID=3346000 RepID=UPI00362E8489